MHLKANQKYLPQTLRQLEPTGPARHQTPAVRPAAESCPSEHSNIDGRNRSLPSAVSSNNRIEHNHALGVAPDRGPPRASTKPGSRPSLPPRFRQKLPDEQELAPAVARQRPTLAHSLHSASKSGAPRYFWTRTKALLTDPIP